MCTFSLFHSGNIFFHVALFFMYCSISCYTFIHCNVFVLHSSSFALFAFCNFFFLHFIHVALFPEVYPGPPQTSKMESFATLIKKVVKYCCKALYLRCLRGPGYASTISMLLFLIPKNIEDKPKTEHTTKKRPYTQHLELVFFLFLFWYPITYFCRYIVLNGW